MNPTNKEYDPNGRSHKEPGAKLDAGKSPVRRGLLEYFPRACLAIAEVSESGANKYSWKGWETVPNGVDRYGDAEIRHICKAAIAGPVDTDYGHLHAAHEAWNALARLELILKEMEVKNDVKPIVGNSDPMASIDLWKCASEVRKLAEDQGLVMERQGKASPEPQRSRVHADHYLQSFIDAGHYHPDVDRPDAKF